jgi:hypothetical protein
MSELETKINALAPLCVLPDMPAETADDVDGIRPVNEAMADLIAFAFACDITRIASYLFVGGAAEAGFPEIGTPSQHGLSHGHNTNALDVRARRLMWSRAPSTRWMPGSTTRCRWLRTSPRSSTPPTTALGGNMLDQTVMLVSSDCSEGFAHSLVDFPLLVIGAGRGAAQIPGRTLPRHEPPQRLRRRCSRCCRPSCRKRPSSAHSPRPTSCPRATTRPIPTPRSPRSRRASSLVCSKIPRTSASTGRGARLRSARCTSDPP